MEYRPLGKSWIEASVVSFGAWAIGGWSWGSGFEDGRIQIVNLGHLHSSGDRV